MFENIIHGQVSLFHTIISMLAIILGFVILLNSKGTRLHKIIGYMYVVSMIALNASSFFIISFGSYSIFHLFSIISLLTVMAGIIPAIRKQKNWFPYHYYFMSWSVVGLYCAFWAEVGTRIVKDNYFWWMLMFAGVLTGLIGARIINIQTKKLNLR